MLLALAWLTISLPYVYSFQQQQKIAQPTETDSEADDECNPLANTTEEKNETSVTSISEYLHDLQLMEHSFVSPTKCFKCHPSQVYFQYHGDLISPPPDANLV
jgi:hypothetical protein